MSQWQNSQGNWNVSPQQYRNYSQGKQASAVRQRSLLVRILLWPFLTLFELVGAIISLALTLLLIAALAGGAYALVFFFTQS